ncbi:MAG: hypothetical protein PHE55_08375 [Methylococcaceae bacterium]|nr:hypothetical protein [Methylococcaceae bacterium]
MLAANATPLKQAAAETVYTHSIDGISYRGYISSMNWDVEYTDEFGEWWIGLSEDEQVSLAASVRLLEECGPILGSRTAAGSTVRGTVICES